MKDVRQHDDRDCGVACLATILRFYGSFIPTVTIREHVRLDKNGVSIYALCRTAEYFGINADGYEATLQEIKDSIKSKEINLPLIAHVVAEGELFHYVVIKKISRKSVVVFDPARGYRKFKYNDFSKMFTGFIVSMKPNENFKKCKLSVLQYKKYIDIVCSQKRLFIGSFIISCVLALLSISSSLAYQTVIDKYILQNSESVDIRRVPIFTDIYLNIESICNTLSQLLGAILLIFIFQILISGLRGILITKIYKQSSEILITNYCTKLLRLPIPFFHDRDTGEILSRYNDIEELQHIISGICLSAIMDIVMAFAGGIVLFSISNVMFTIVCGMIISYGLIVICYIRPIKTISREIMESDSKLMSKLKESIDGIETIKASCAENYILNVIQKRVKAYVGSIEKGSFVSLSQSVLMGLCQNIGNVVLLYYGCRFILTGNLTLGEFVSFETLLYFFISPVQNIFSMQLVLQQAFVAADRLNDVMEGSDDHNDCLKNCFNEKSATVMETTQLRFSYGYNDEVLKGITLKFTAGDRVALIGKSGCGKTTLLHVLGRLEENYTGKVVVNNRSIKDIDKNAYRKMIIYVPQETIIFADTIKNNILLGCEADELKLNKILEGCQLKEFIVERVNGIDTILEENGASLSGGQKQRIAIARALIREPRILLLDESTSHIDNETEERIFNYIKKEYPNMICICTTHNEKLMEICNSVVCIENGKIKKSN